MRFIILYVIFFSLSTNAQKPYLKRNQPASKYKWFLSFSDDFRKESTIEKKWIAQNSSPGHILSSRWRENISIKNGKLLLKNKKEQRGGKEWTSGCITCKTNNGYGYYEARLRISGASGVNNSFWMSAGRAENKNSFEIDFIEVHYPDEIHYTVHDYGIESNSYHTSVTEVLKMGIDLSSKFHVYGVCWNEKTIDFYFDGRIKWSTNNNVCKHIGPMVFSTAILNRAGSISDNINNTMMVVDYVRYWKNTAL